PDVLPVGDYGVRKGMQALYGLAELPKPAEMERIAEPWRPYRTVASWYVWRNLDPVTGGG
ncbi:MAG TPA: DNA-3-methyladenine glycosylase 2 family protein, partial [Myxococcota bacterium]|nr:DNA-3-methyladenine glycosylase 2 family protein [Myxococcota bacterium]